jgi:hypothetical protein
LLFKFLANPEPRRIARNVLNFASEIGGPV